MSDRRKHCAFNYAMISLQFKVRRICTYVFKRASMMYPTPSVLVCCGAMLFPACTPNSRTTPTPITANVDWTAKDLAGLEVTLVDPVRIEWMSFQDDGHVSITIGEKNISMTAPIFIWRIVSGRLRLIDDDKIYEELTLITRDSKTIVARRRNGQLATYKILRQRRLPNS